MMLNEPDSASPDHDDGSVASADGIIQLIRNWIETAELKEGDRLPTERALAEQFNLNRNLVRRAFLQLDKLGLIHRHVGRGTFVGASKPRTPPHRTAAPAAHLDAVRDADFSPAAILQARSMLEPQVAALAVASARQADLRVLNSVIDRAAIAATQDELLAIDIEFHEALAAATNNDLVVELARVIAAARMPSSGRRLASVPVADSERVAITDEYRAILDALGQRDPTAAGNAMRAPLLRATRAFSMLARMELLPETE